MNVTVQYVATGLGLALLLSIAGHLDGILAELKRQTHLANMAHDRDVVRAQRDAAMFGSSDEAAGR